MDTKDDAHLAQSDKTRKHPRLTTKQLIKLWMFSGTVAAALLTAYIVASSAIESFVNQLFRP